MLAGEFDDLVSQLGRFAVHPDFIQQPADAAGCPKARDISPAYVVFHEANVTDKFPRLAVQRAGDFDRSRSATRIAAEDGQRFSLEQTGQFVRIELSDLHVAGESERNVRQHGRFNLAEEVAELHFDVFLRQHILTERVGLLGDAIQQVGIHIGAEAE